MSDHELEPGREPRGLTRTAAGRRVLFTACYFVEGAPIGFLWWCLPSLMRSRGIEPADIGALLAWLALPWAFKWVWAPVIDALQSPRWTLRAWIGGAQVAMVATLVPLLLADDFLESPWLVPCLVAHALFAATQDAGIDALMIRTTPVAERGRLAGWMQVGMLSARGLFGGGALLLVERGEERFVVVALLAAVTFGLLLLPTYRAPGPQGGRRRARELARSLRAAVRHRATWAMLAFAAVGGAGFEGLGSFAGPLLTERSGGDTTLSGEFYLLPAVVASAVGALAGGALADRLGARRGALVAGAVLGVVVLSTAAVIALLPEAEDALVPWLVAVYVAIGGFTAASYALFMRWTDPRLGATQFSAYMGATNLCETWAVAVAGSWIGSIGYGAAFAALGLVGLAGLAFVELAERSGGRGPDAV